MAAVAAIGAGVSLIGGAVSANQAKKAGQGARNDANRARAEIAAIKAARVDIVNPYANQVNLSGLAENLSGMMNNPFSSLGVATQAAEIKMEQADIALANTLDTIKSTGAGAGGATALAQAALASKKGVAADIEAQEAKNEQLRAQGEASLQAMKVSEEQRLQGIAISEGQRLQAGEAAGKTFQMQMEEARSNADLGYEAGNLANAMQSQSNAAAAEAGAWGSAISGVTGMASSALQFKAAEATSDRRLKKNIKLISKSNSGLNIYAFEYIDKIFGKGVFQGVMSDEVPTAVVIKGKDGYDRVDYSKLDVEFKNI
jgi:hypothetical protein